MPVQLTQQDVEELRKKGFSDAEISKAISEIETEEMQQMSSNSNSQSNNAPRRMSSFSSGRMDDIAKYQLELNDLLEQTEHILKGDVVMYENGERQWHDNPHPEKNPLNDEGIRKIMLELQNYINRHIILGDYDMKDINGIMKDYGNKLKNLVFMKYEEMGMDTQEKRQEYASIVMNVVNLVYGSYARAKDGGERRSLREMINTGYSYQAQGYQNPNQNGMQMNAPQRRGVLNPMRYIAGKYV